MSDSKFTTKGDEPIEARIVSWVLGEASAFEAAELERLCEQQPELAIFKRRIQAVHGLVGEGATRKSDPAWKLPPAKRVQIEKLIGAEVKEIREAAREQRIRRSGRQAMLAIAACLVLTLVVATLTWPIFMSRSWKGAAENGEQSIIVSYSYAPETDDLKELNQPAQGGWHDDGGVILGKKEKRMMSFKQVAGELPSELIEGTPKPMNVPGLVDPSATPAMQNFSRSGEELQKGRASKSDADHNGLEPYAYNALGGGAPHKPAAPSSSVAKVITSGVVNEVAIPVPETATATPSLDFGKGGDFGKGWGAGSGGALYSGDKSVDAFEAPANELPNKSYRYATGSTVLPAGRLQSGPAHEEAERMNKDQLSSRRLADADAEIDSSSVTLSVNGGVQLEQDHFHKKAEQLRYSLDARDEKMRELQPGDAPTAPLIAGNRSGDFAIMGNSIDALLSDAKNGKANGPQAEALGLDDAIVFEEMKHERGEAGLDEIVDLERTLEPRIVKKPIVLDEETVAAEEPYSTFSLNISDASFRIAQASLARGEMPDPAGIKVEQFYNAVDYGDAAPPAGQPVACNIEQAAHPVIPGRKLVRVAVKTASAGRSQGQPLRLTLLIDQSGSMAREDRRQAMIDALEGLRGLLTEQDQVQVIGFARTPRLLAESLSGNQGAQLAQLVNIEANEGGTNLEEAIKLGEKLAERHQLEGAQNRMVLFTDGAANLGDADPDSLSDKIKALRQKGIAFDIAGIAADELNDDLLGELARHGNGRYYVVGKGETTNFAEKLAGAFRPAAENVKVQVHFNPERVGRYKLIGFEKDRLNKEDFRNDAVDAAELAAEEAGVAIYQVETLPEGEGEIGEVSVRFRDVASGQMVERSWTMAHDPSAPAMDKAQPTMQLAILSMLAGEKLKGGALADAIDFSQWVETQAKVAQHFRGDGRVAEMLQMVDQLK